MTNNAKTRHWRKSVIMLEKVSWDCSIKMKLFINFLTMNWTNHGNFVENEQLFAIKIRYFLPLFCETSKLDEILFKWSQQKCIVRGKITYFESFCEIIGFFGKLKSCETLMTPVFDCKTCTKIISSKFFVLSAFFDPYV